MASSTKLPLFSKPCSLRRPRPNKVIKPEDALRYAWSLPVASVLVGCDSSAVLKRTLKSAAGFKAFHAGEMDALRQKARPTAGDGRYERYKTTQEYDGAAGKAAHGFG